MKKLVFLLILSIFSLSYAQDAAIKPSQFGVFVSYGLAKTSFNKDFASTSTDIDFSVPSYGTSLQVGLEYAISDLSFVGISYELQRYKNELNLISLNPIPDVEIPLFLTNYANVLEYTYYQIYLRRAFKNNLGIQFGLFYLTENFNTINNNVFVSENGDLIPFVEIGEVDENLKEFGGSFAVNYEFKINNFVSIAPEARIYVSLSGVESWVLQPVFRVKF